MDKLRIGQRVIGRGEPVFVIAEAGVNHNHNLDLALKLVDAAAKSGADAIKFQAFKADQVVVKTAPMVEYQEVNLGKSGSQLDMLGRLEFEEEWYPAVIERCNERGLIFLSTPHGSFASIDLLQEIGVPAFKFGSGDLTSLPLLRYAAKFKKPIILGTGMATLDEVTDAVIGIRKVGNSRIILLHCTTNYPCPYGEVNLRAMTTMSKELGLPTGYSDHTIGTQVAVMAVALGAVVIEKHLTLDNDMEGPDHRASANPELFKRMVHEIRMAEVILGSKVKKPSPSERRLQASLRRSIVAIADIGKGEELTMRNIDLRRPGTGMSPHRLNGVLGKKARRNIRQGSMVKKSMLFF